MRRLLFPVVLLLTAGARGALACECVEVGPKLTAKEWLAKLDGVAFSGRVLDVAEVEESEGGLSTLRREVTFEVEEVWKGEVGAEVRVRTGVGGGDCGIKFVKGEKYFVEAGAHRQHLSTGICDKTTNYASAEKLLRELGSGKRPAKNGAQKAP